VPFIERLLGTEQILAKEVYYISSLALGAAVGRREHDHRSLSFVLSLVATLYPSWRASRVNPAEALRYE
jgi:lipoprotein-releasing system permease protein